MKETMGFGGGGGLVGFFFGGGGGGRKQMEHGSRSVLVESLINSNDFCFISRSFELFTSL